MTIKNTANGENIFLKTTSGNSLITPVKIHSGGVFESKFGSVFNEDSADVDFRVEGNSDANLLFVDASTDRVGIGKSGPSELLDVDGTLNTTNFKVGGAQGSDGQVLTSTGSGVGWESIPSSGGLILISADVVTSNTATISRGSCFSSTYDDYLVIFHAEAHSSTADLIEFQFLNTSGQAFTTTDYAYDRSDANNQYDKDAFFGDNGLTMNRQEYQSLPATIQFYVHHPQNNTYWASIHGTYHRSDTDAPVTFSGSYRVDDATIGGIKFLLAGSENFAVGSSLRVYGIAKS